MTMADPATATPDPTDIDAYLSKRGMMTYPQIDAKRQELIGQYETAGEKESAGIEQGAAARKKLMGGGIQSPAAPKLQNLPAPPDNQPQSPFQAFGSPAVFLASIGSLFTRHPLKVALDSAAAAMKGYHEGDQQAAQAQQERWKEATETAVKQNQVELDKYNAAWKSTEHDVAERQAKMQAIAAGVQDEVMLAAIKTGNLDRVWHMLDSRQQANDKLQEAILREHDRQEGLDIQRQRLAQYGTGRSAITMYMSRFLQEHPNASAEEVKRAAQEYTTQTTAQNRFLSGPQGNTIRSLNVVVSHLQTMQDLGDALKNSDIPAFNRVAQRFAEETGSSAPTNFDTAKQIVGAEIIKALGVAGAGTQSERQEASDAFNRARSPEQLAGAISAAKKLLVGQLEGMRRQFIASTGLPASSFDEMLQPETQEYLKSEGTKPPGKSPEAPPASMLQEGQPTTIRNKKTGEVQTWTLQNGQPVKVK